jgi:hypothetical protein
MHAPLILLFAVALACSGDPLALWNDFECNVRDGRISRDSALGSFPAIYSGLKTSAEQHKYNSGVKWRVPVEHGSLADFGKGGFRPAIQYGGSNIRGYNFFDGNRHGGHPAYDIFIVDTNNDCRDDRSLKSVNVVAPLDMYVITTNGNWKHGSPLRGGNYVWAMVPDSNFVLYFAHMDSIYTVPGAFVQQGGILGTVGRSGKNADDPRSPTHVHMMVLHVHGTDLIPIDFVAKFK